MGSCLKQENATFTSPSKIHLFIVHESDSWSRDLNIDFTLKDCLYEGVELSAKNADPDTFVYIGFGIGFDSRLEFSLPDGSVGKNAIIFGVDMSLSAQLITTKKDILILGKGPTQQLNGTTLAAERKYSINFSKSFFLFKPPSLYYNVSNSCLIVHATKKQKQKKQKNKRKLKANNSEIKIIFLVLRKYFRRFFS